MSTKKKFEIKCPNSSVKKMAEKLKNKKKRKTKKQKKYICDRYGGEKESTDKKRGRGGKKHKTEKSHK